MFSAAWKQVKLDCILICGVIGHCFFNQFKSSTFFFDSKKQGTISTWIYWLLPLVTRKKVEGCMPTNTLASLARWGMQVFCLTPKEKEAQLLTPQCKNLWTLFKTILILLILKLESCTDGFKAAQDWFLSLQGLDKNQSWDQVGVKLWHITQPFGLETFLTQNNSVFIHLFYLCFGVNPVILPFMQ